MWCSEPAAPRAPDRTVLVVDDSAFMRRVVAELVDACPGFRTVATARDGAEALRLVHAIAPDIVTLDVAMPALDGLAALAYIMREVPRPVIMLSAADDAADVTDGPSATVRALELGAVDFVPKPSGPISLDLVAVRGRLHDALRAAACANLGGPPALGRPARVAEPRAAGQSRRARRAVVIAASTGGPGALTRVLPRLPRALDAAVLVAQHMPPGFTASFARRLDALCALRVAEARDGEPVTAGRVYVGPGGVHLRVARDGGGAPVIALDDDAPRWGVRPSADLLFASATAVFGAATVGVVLTGMGCDGADGLGDVRRAGGRAIVQDRATSAVYGMPNAALAAAGADRVAGLAEVPDAIVAFVAALAPSAAG